MEFPKFFLVSAVIPVMIASFIYKLMNADLLGGVTELKGS